MSAAILLAGGRASRMGGVAKPLLEVGGVSMLARAITAVRDAGAAPIAVVGPTVAGIDAEVEWLREDPPFTGPAAAVVAALGAWADRPLPEWVFLLACDLPRADAAVATLTRDSELLPADTDGLCLGDAASRPQWLTGVYRAAPLRAAASALADAGRDQPVRALLAGLAIAVVPAPEAARDVDTWEDYRKERDDA